MPKDKYAKVQEIPDVNFEGLGAFDDSQGILTTTVAKWSFSQDGEIIDAEPEALSLIRADEEVLEELILNCEKCGEDYRRRLAFAGKNIVTTRQPCQCSLQPGEGVEKRKERRNREISKYFSELNLLSRKDLKIKELKNIIALQGQEVLLEHSLAFLRSPKAGKAFLISGLTGRGKSEFALAIGKALMLEKSVIALKSLDLQEKIRRFLWEEKQRLEIIRQLKEVDLLIIEDLGKEKAPEWINSIIYAVIEGRYGRKDTIITTSNTPKALIASLGEVLSSRILAFREVKLEGVDWRLEGRKKLSWEWD